jgi:hypothetical protein
MWAVYEGLVRIAISLGGESQVQEGKSGSPPKMWLAAQRFANNS